MATNYKIKGTLVIVNPNLSGVDPATPLDLFQSFTIKLIAAPSANPLSSENGFMKVDEDDESNSIAPLQLQAQQSLPVPMSSYVVYFNWSDEKGIPVAFVIRNYHPSEEFYLVSLTMEGIPNHSPIDFVCRSWVYPDSKYENPRIFFINKSYLPSETPQELRKYREKELKNLRGDGSGERKKWERIYDYALYNDLGKPDQSSDLARPVLGGSSDFPYPRRGRTGRPPTQSDPNTESRLPDDQGFDVYVPRDDRFGDQKLFEFVSHFPKSLMNSLKSFVKAELVSKQEEEFESFEDVSQVLYEDGFSFPVPQQILDAIAARLPIPVPSDGILKLLYSLPALIQDNLDEWKTNEEFAREMLAGVNPGLIRLLQEFPPKSKLDPDVYGDQTSKITKEQLQENLDGLTVDEAVKSKKLFILDHHDSFMPYLRKINETTRKAYATRTILFLQDNQKLKPLAIELSLPDPKGDKYGAVSEVYLPATEGVKASLWFLAKAYVIVNDTGYHQLVSHWLNTHATMEPFVIATHRHLSVLHPIHKLLHPHFHDNMFINALARQNLISADGIIENSFLPGKYSMEMSSVVYKNWNFLDHALPADLIKRGMAVEDSKASHGLDLVIKDYPYAVDGLDIWDAIKTWVHDYVLAYYKTDDTIKQDTELQSWWTEVVEVGHGDLKDKTWWPKMQSREELIHSCTIIIWTSSALHAAVNFGQYPYGGYILNRPTLSRRLIPKEGSEEYDELVKEPKVAFLKTITPKYETFLDLSIIEILSTHTSDEVYLGTRDNPNWTSDAKALEAFEKFGKRLAEIEETLKERNKDKTLVNRVGPVKMPYTLLYPTSEPGLTGRGIPNSISIYMLFHLFVCVCCNLCLIVMCVCVTLPLVLISFFE